MKPLATGFPGFPQWSGNWMMPAALWDSKLVHRNEGKCLALASFCKMVGSDATFWPPKKNRGQETGPTSDWQNDLVCSGASWTKIRGPTSQISGTYVTYYNLVCSGISRCCHHRHWSQGWHIIGNRACSHWCAQNSWDTSREKRWLKWSMDSWMSINTIITHPKRCQKVALVSKCVQSLMLFSSMLVSFQPSWKNHHQFLHPLHHCWKSPLSEFASRKKRCLCLNANCQSAMQGRKCPTDVVHPLTYGEETDRVSVRVWCWHCCFVEVISFL